jgi:aspartate aminotransferase-like enzyme
MVAPGQRELKGKILRVSPIGKSRRDILAFARAFEAAMVELERPFALGDIANRLEVTLEDSSLWE